VSGSLLPSHGYVGKASLTVRTTSLAEILGETRRAECDVLKLDIEGAEYDVLQALCEDGTIRRCRQLLVEFHHHGTDRTLQDTHEAIERLQSRGFELSHTEDRNCLFVRRDQKHAG
jgi:hypothetical protein